MVLIPSGLAFADLRLAMERNGDVTYDIDVVHRILSGSGLPSHFGRREEWVFSLICGWYRAAVDAGEPIHLVPEALLLVVDAGIPLDVRLAQRVH